MNTCGLKASANKIRRVTCDMVLYRGDGHIGDAPSMNDALAVSFGNYMKEEDWFVLPEGHAGSAYYVVLMLAGRLNQKHIHTSNEDGTLLPSRPDRMKTPGVQVTTGSLGQGTPQAAGITYVLKAMKRKGNVFYMVGDGECNGGEVFEALQFIANKRLNSCTVMADCNKKQVDGLLRKVSCDFDFPTLLQSTGFHVCEVDGNAVEAVNGKLSECTKRKERANALLLNTARGAEISYFKQQEDPHYVTFNEAGEQALQDYINLTGKELNT